MGVNVTGRATVIIKNNMRTGITVYHSYLSIYLFDRDNNLVRAGQAFCCQDGVKVQPLTEIHSDFYSILAPSLGPHIWEPLADQILSTGGFIKARLKGLVRPVNAGIALLSPVDCEMTFKITGLYNDKASMTSFPLENIPRTSSEVGVHIDIPLFLNAKVIHQNCAWGLTLFENP